MVFGVDNEFQIQNEEFRNNRTVKKSLIKPEINRRLKTGIARDTNNIIDNSNVIVVYGMSIGATDATWWKHIIDWLKNNHNVQLIIFVYQEEYNQLLARSFMDIEDSTEDRFFSYSILNERSKEEISNRIHIVINKNLIPVKYISNEDKVKQAYKRHILGDK